MLSLIKETPIIRPYLELILGPMYSGKTSQIIDLYNKYTFCNIPIVVINHPIDTRYHNDLLSSASSLSSFITANTLTFLHSE